LGYKLPVSPPPSLPDSQALSPLFSGGGQSGTQREREKTLAVKFPGEGGGAHPPPSQRKQFDGEARKRNKLSSTHCTTPWRLVVDVCIWLSVDGVVTSTSINTLS